MKKKKMALGLLLMLPLWPRLAWTQNVDYSIGHEDLVKSMMEHVRAANIESIIRRMSGFKTRFYRSKDAYISQGMILHQWRTLVGHREHISVDYFHHKYPSDLRPRARAGETAMPSVILTMKGHTFPDEIIVIGGHADSIALKRSPFMLALDQAPGADDNASGIAVITEIIRILSAHNYRPQRTIKFMAFAAEEIGLVGPEEIATQQRERDENVIGMLNLDMTNYKGSDDLHLTLVDDFTSPEQNAFLADLIKAYLPKISWEYISCRYACSDHASWHKNNFRASMLFEARFQDTNPFVHTSDDTIEQSGGHAEHSVIFAQLGVAYLVELDR